jgi:hypothetical protein
MDFIDDRKEFGNINIKMDARSISWNGSVQGRIHWGGILVLTLLKPRLLLRATAIQFVIINEVLMDCTFRSMGESINVYRISLRKRLCADVEKNT